MIVCLVRLGGLDQTPLDFYVPREQSSSESTQEYLRNNEDFIYNSNTFGRIAAYGFFVITTVQIIGILANDRAPTMVSIPGFRKGDIGRPPL
jgi:hypothetical protein